MMLFIRFEFIFFIGLISLCNGVKAQIDSSSQAKKDISFATHLIRSEQFEDAVYFINNVGHKAYINNYADSLNYLKGWAFYNLKQLDSAAVFLLKVNNSSFTKEKSHFFAAYSHIYLGNKVRAEEILKYIPLQDSQSVELKNLELAGIALLNRNYENYDHIRKSFSYSRFSLTEAETSLDKLSSKLKAHKSKSPAIAGLMSAIVPGSGKIYSGRIGEGVSAFLSNAILAGITLENYHKAGPKNFKTIFFGSLFTIFYTGNVYGSMVSVKVSQNEFNSSYDKAILFDIHIPLRTIFN